MFLVPFKHYKFDFVVFTLSLATNIRFIFRFYGVGVFDYAKRYRLKFAMLVSYLVDCSSSVSCSRMVFDCFLFRDIECGF